MPGTYTNLIRKAAAALLSLFFILGLCTPVSAAESDTETLRVAFPELKGFSMTDEEGRRSGLVVDFLNEISKYTGWKYEYIDCDSETMVEDFLAGEYDLMGGTYYNAAFKDYFGYPDYGTGTSKSVLLARWDDESISGYDLRDLNGKRIGVFEGAMENIRRMNQYLDMNGISCEIVQFGKDDIVDGKLYHKLTSGEVDLLLGNAAEKTGEFRVVGQFDAQPHYIVTQPTNTAVLDDINHALELIYSSNPDFAEECYEKNFPEDGNNLLMLSHEEQEYVASHDKITVAIPRDFHPFYCKGLEDGDHDGIIPDILERVSDFSGLTFEYVLTDSYGEALTLVRTGEAEMLGVYLDGEYESISDGLALTKSYIQLPNVIVRNSAVSYPDQTLTRAVLTNQRASSRVKADEIKSYESSSELLRAVNSGEADFTYGVAAQIEYVLQREALPNCKIVSTYEGDYGLSFAMRRPTDEMLFAIINKAISDIPTSETTVIGNTNLVSTGDESLSLMQLFYANPTAFLVIAAALIVIIIASILLVAASRVRAANMRAGLAHAEAESRAKSQFLSQMSHEIRTPMSTIVGLTELLGGQSNIPPDISDKLAKLRSASQYLLQLLNDILDMSRIDSGMMTIVSEPFSLAAALAETQSMMNPQAEHQGIVFEPEFKTEHDALSGDVIRLKQVLVNLLSNAIKFTPAGGHVYFLVEEMQSDDTGAVYKFSVADDGVGIQPEDQKRIFEVFEQSGTNFSRSRGTGLGLPICRSLVRLMGGELFLESEPGAGSKFFFTIRLPYGQFVEPQEALSTDSRQLNGMNLLLVEDNEINSMITCEILGTKGARIQCVYDGQQAVDAVSNSEPGEYDAILMDIQMPVMNGLDAARAIRALPRPDAASIPILAMTANTFQEDVDAAMDAGMNDFAKKPIDIDLLCAQLFRVCGKKGDGL